MLLSAVSAPVHNPPLTSLQLCQICFSEVVCATFWARESKPASPASGSVCPLLQRGCDRLMGTLQHYSASSERLEAGELVMA